jgi:TolA-binding protein
MKRVITSLIMAALLLLPGMAAAQAPAGSQASPLAQPEHPAAPPAAAPQQCQMGPGGTCMMPGQMTPEQMKQMQGKMGQCCMMQPGQGCARCEQLQKQLDDLQKRVEALEGKKGKKK